MNLPLYSTTPCVTKLAFYVHFSVFSFDKYFISIWLIYKFSNATLAKLIMPSDSIETSLFLSLFKWSMLIPMIPLFIQSFHCLFSVLIVSTFHCVAALHQWAVADHVTCISILFSQLVFKKRNKKDSPPSLSSDYSKWY